MPESTAPQAPKSFLTSKTFWFGLAVTGVGLLEVLQQSPLISQYPGVIAGIGSVILVLRYLTTGPVGLLPPMPTDHEDA
jgi:hypothetical protein